MRDVLPRRSVSPALGECNTGGSYLSPRPRKVSESPDHRVVLRSRTSRRNSCSLLDFLGLSLALLVLRDQHPHCEQQNDACDANENLYSERLDERDHHDHEHEHPEARSIAP